MTVPETRTLTVVACAAGPVGRIGELLTLAQSTGWQVDLIATPAAEEFLDVAAIEEATGVQARTKPGSRDPVATRPTSTTSAIVVVPATFNTINKLAHGICDNYALTSVAEAIGRRVPVVVLPFVNSALAARTPFARSVASLRSEGVTVIVGEEYGWTPHAPGTGKQRLRAFPWALAIRHAERSLGPGRATPTTTAATGAGDLR